MSIELGGLLTAMAQLVVIGGGLAGIYWGIKRWVSDISKNAKSAAQRLETSNGHTVGDYVEEIASSVDELKGMARDNRTRIEVMETWRNEHTRGHP